MTDAPWWDQLVVPIATAECRCTHRDTGACRFCLAQTRAWLALYADQVAEVAIRGVVARTSVHSLAREPIHRALGVQGET